MPKYDYKCIGCNNKEEKRVIFWESLQFCSKCSASMERLFSPQGITFRIKKEENE